MSISPLLLGFTKPKDERMNNPTLTYSPPLYMADGPDYQKLFTEMQALNIECNLKEIIRYLRFFQGEANYKIYLEHYYPMLPAECRKQFAKDAKELGIPEPTKKPSISGDPVEEPKTHVGHAKVESSEETPEEKPKKKRGRPAKNPTPSTK